MTMKRDQALEALAEHYTDGIVVPVFQSAFDWMQIRPHALNYLCTGAMGQASSHALGVALACPDEQVLVLDGDGSLLMNLGCLVTTAEQSPKNLWHFVSNNGIYEVNGEFPVPGKNVDFAGLAAAAGFKRTYSFSDIDTFRRELPEVLGGEGPVFVSMDVEIGKVYPRDYVTIDSADSRKTFRNALRERLGS